MKITRKKKTKTVQGEAANGDGPVDAAYNTIDKLLIREKILMKRPKLVDYKIRSITVGKDAQGEVMTKVSYRGMTFTGRGTSTDIIEASIRSYLNAVNRIVTTSVKGGRRSSKIEQM